MLFPPGLILTLPSAAAQSLKATRNFSVSDWSKNFEVVFQDEEGTQKHLDLTESNCVSRFKRGTSASVNLEPIFPPLSVGCLKGQFMVRYDAPCLPLASDSE